MKLRVNPDALAKLSPSQRAEVEAQLRELEAIRQENPLVFYEPHPKQVEFHSAKQPIKCFLGGNRAGKTTAGIVDDLIQAVDRPVLPDHLLPFKRWEPPFYCRIVIPDLGQTLEGVTLQKIRDWCPPSQLRGGSVDEAFDARLRTLHFKNGSWFQFNSNEQELSKLSGVALRRVHFDEEPRADIHQESIMRLIDFGGDRLFTMTPLLGLSWTFTEIYEPWERGELPDAHIVQVDMDDNPHLDEAAKTLALAGLSHEERQARKAGRFVHFAGLIYDCFDVDRHRAPVLDELPVLRKDLVGIDPGIRHMAAVLLGFLDADDTLTIFDEICLQGRTIEEVCDEYHLRCARWGFRPGAWNVIDPAAQNRDMVTGRSLQDTFRRHGVPTILGQNSRIAGINAVKERFQSDRLVIAANCTTLIDQLRRYRWKSPTRIAESSVPEEPVRRDDHTCDALRYMVMSPMVTPRRPPAVESATTKDRLLREHLRHLQRPRLQHPAGPGVFA